MSELDQSLESTLSDDEFAQMERSARRFKFLGIFSAQRFFYSLLHILPKDFKEEYDFDMKSDFNQLLIEHPNSITSRAWKQYIGVLQSSVTQRISEILKHLPHQIIN